MAQWSTLRDDELDQIRRSNGLCFDLDSPVKGDGIDENNCKDKLRSFFDQVLSGFLRNKYICPLPVLLGNGSPADLFKLFWTVRRRGGYDVVSKNGLWGFVAKECGLGVGVMAAVKLIYFKYLNELDKWLLRVFRDSSLGNRENGVVEKLNLLSLELEEFKGTFLGYQLKNNHGELVDLEFSKNGSSVDLDINTSELHSSSSENSIKLHKNVERSINDDDEKFIAQDDDKVVVTAKIVVENVINSQKMINDDIGETSPVQDDDNIVLVAKSIVENVISSGKRKRESLSISEMLNWVIQAAKHHDDPAIGKIPECSKWKEHGSEELWSQALLARDALLIRRHVDPDTEESLLQKKMRMHPSMYEDNNAPNHQSTERLRCSERLPVTKTLLCPCCNTCSSTQPKLASPRKAEAKTTPKEPKTTAKGPKTTAKGPKTIAKEPKITPKEPAPLIVELSTIDTPDDILKDDRPQKQVYVGPGFQAEIPEWTGIITNSDSKWLGTKMWPPEDGKNKLPLLETGPIVGKGRQNNPCNCRLPDSTECVRFHIAEKRMGLRREIGLLFYKWRFDRMGEEVSLSWTIEEEKRFKQMVSSYHVAPYNFWNNSFRFFPTKTRAKLVSYYFNVLLVRRRSYQNRVMPNNIDSDDDEKEFGSVGDSFGYEAIHGPGSKVIICSQNKQCTDLE